MSGVRGQRSGGHNKKSAHLHLLRGTFRRDRHGDPEAAAVPPVAAAVPKPRKTLNGEAKREWDRVVADLTESNGLAHIDGGRLFQYVNLFAEVEAIREQSSMTQHLLKKAKKAMAKLDGIELLQAMEQVVKLQQLAVRQTGQLRQGRMALRQYLNDLGLTPVQRHGKSGAGTSSPPAKSRLQTFKSGG